MPEPTARSWKDIAPKDATGLNLAADLTIDAPLNEQGARCPWPWGPQQLIGSPLGQYHCPYCRAMCVAGMPHLDYRDAFEILADASEVPDA
jgi:hypothetical protein